MSHRNSSSSTQQQACAACKYQRRKCAPDCILAPYFPHDRQLQFLNAHKLFGVSNITKIIKNLPPSLQYDAMQSIIFQSDARRYDPVGGCYRIVLELEREIESVSAEYRFVCQQLAMYRAQEQQQQHQSQQTSQLQHQSASNEVVASLYYQQDHHSQNNVNHPFVVQPQEQYIGNINIMEENGDQGQVDNGDNLQEDDPSAWVVHDSTLSLLNIKDQFIDDCGDNGNDLRNHDDGDDVELKPVMSNHYDQNLLMLEDQKNIQLGDRNGYMNGDKQVIPKEDCASFKDEQEHRDFELAAATLFPLTSCASVQSATARDQREPSHNAMAFYEPV